MVTASVLDRTVRVVDVNIAQIETCTTALEDLYRDTIDVVIIRQAFCPEQLQAAGQLAQQEGANLAWLNPNPPEMAGEDIQVLGVSLTPSGKLPTGPVLNDYLDQNLAYRAAIDHLFDPAFNPQYEIERVLGQIGNGRQVESPRTMEGRSYTPYTVRSLFSGQGIGVHHDYHFDLPAYKALAAQSDTRTLISFLTPLAVPEAGGELVVYALTLENPNKPMLPNGRWDPDRIVQQYDTVCLRRAVGDLVAFAAGRCLHRVTPVVGTVPRITLGGFLAFDRNWEKVLYWS